MNLMFERIRVHNFMCFEDAELFLNDVGYISVSGVNNRVVDGALSNGSGKSSMFNAICYALTGETLQGVSKNVANIYTDPNDSWVELEFMADFNRIIVRRFIAPRSDMTIYVNGENKSGKGIRESSKILEQYLPNISSKLIGSIIILGQGMPQRFAQGNPSQRKETLEKLTNSDYMIQAIREKLDNRQSELKHQLRAQENDLVATNTRIEMYNNQIKEYSYSNTSIIEDSKKTIETLSNDIASNNDTLSELEKEIFEYQQENIKFDNEIANLLSKKSADQLNVEHSHQQEWYDLQQEKNSLIIKEKELNSEILKAESITDICPTCHQRIIGVVKVDTEPLKNELSKIITLKEKVDNKIDVLSKTKQSLIQEINLKYSSLQSEIENMKNHNLDSLNDSIQLKTNLIQTNASKQSEIARLTVLISKYEEYTYRVKDLTLKLEQDSALKVNLEAEIAISNQRLKIISDLISLTKRDFRNILLKNILTYLNHKVKEYSKQVFGTDLLSIDINDNYIDIMYDNKYYETLSGGEKQKVDIIIQLSLKELLGEYSNTHTNILVLDEIFDNLDSSGCQNVLKLISNISNVSSIFIISHHIEELQISYDNRLVVEKNNEGISTISIY